MKRSFFLRFTACLVAVAIAATAAADSLRFSDLSGWWSADPAYGGESAHIALQFLEKDGKPEAQFSATHPRATAGDRRFRVSRL